MIFRFLSVCFCLILTCLISSDLSAADKVYRIGNSLTWDSQPKGIEALAAQRGHQHVEGYHINCGKSLERIWKHPDEVCVKVVEPFGTFANALPNHDWDAVTFQAHPGEHSTLGTDTTQILNFISKTQEKGRNQKTVFYIYAAWPGKLEQSFATVWNRKSPDKENTPSHQNREYFQHLLQRVRSKTKADVRMIPVGHVLAEFDRRIQAGKVPGFQKINELYRDPVHLTNTGRFLAGVTTLTTLYGENPQGIKFPTNAYGNGKGVTRETTQAILDTIWEVVTAENQATGVPREKQPE